MYYQYRFNRNNFKIIHNGVSNKEFGIINKFLINGSHSGYVLVNSSGDYEFHSLFELPNSVKTKYVNHIINLHKRCEQKQVRTNELDLLFKDN